MSGHGAIAHWAGNGGLFQSNSSDDGKSSEDASGSMSISAAAMDSEISLATDRKSTRLNSSHPV